LLDALLIGHLALQAARITAAAFLFLVLYAIGASIVRTAVGDPVERLLLRIAAGFAVFQCVVRWLGELPLLTARGVWMITIALALLGLLTRWRMPDADAAEHPFASNWRVVIIVLLLIAPLTMALAPAVSQDALIYHLRFPESTLRDGRWAIDPANSSSYYPAATGTLYLAALALDHQGVIAQLVHFGFFILAILAAAAIARRLGAPSGRTAALLLAAIPCAGVVAGWAWADLSLLFAIGAAVLAAFGGMFAIALLLLGLAASIKYTALVACIPIAIAIVVAALRARQSRQLFIGIVLAVAVASPWYLMNVVHTGNPVYPLATSLFGGASHSAQSMVETWSRADGGSWLSVWTGYFLAPQTLDEDIGGPLFLIVAILGFLIAFRSQRTPLRIAAWIALAMWTLFLPLTAAMRLLLPAIAATLIVAGAALEQATRARRALALLLIVFALRGGIIAAAHDAHFMNPLPAAVGIEKESEYVARNFPPAPLYARLDRTLPPDARFVAYNEVRLFRFPRPVSASRVLDPPLLARYIEGAQTPAEILARFRRDRVTHLLIAPKPVERGPVPRFSPRAEQLFTTVIRMSRVIDREGSTVAIELPP